MTENQFLLLALAVLLGFVAGFVLFFVPWMDRRDAAHYRNISERARVACGSDHSIDAKAHARGWWYEVKCRRSDGSVYVVVVK